MREPADKPGSVEDNHSSGDIVTDALKRPTRESVRADGAPEDATPLFGLAPSGVYPAAECCHPRGALLPHHFTLTGTMALRRYIFCGTFRRLAPPRRYLALWPMEPGLSSQRKAHCAIAWPTPSRAMLRHQRQGPLINLVAAAAGQRDRNPHGRFQRQFGSSSSCSRRSASPSGSGPASAPRNDDHKFPLRHQPAVLRPARPDRRAHPDRHSRRSWLVRGRPPRGGRRRNMCRHIAAELSPIRCTDSKKTSVRRLVFELRQPRPPRLGLRRQEPLERERIDRQARPPSVRR